MLRITKLADAEYLLSQVVKGIDDYYTGTGEAPGVWQGDLAEELGLVGVVDADELRRLLLARHPVTDTELLAGHRARKVAAFDVTFSAPKSVSLLWAFAGPEVSSVASIAHVEAVAVALDFLERRAGATRQQVDGERRRVPTGVAAGTFVHRTSREADPQLHTHAVVVNLGRRADGSLAALDAAPLYEWGKAAGSVYQEELRRRLSARLGVEWGPDRHGCREMAGFDPGWLRTFSKRTVAIEEHLAGAGPEQPDRTSRMRADEAASLATRPRKDGSLTPGLLEDRWRAEAEAIGMPTCHALEAQVCDRVIPRFRPQVEWQDVAQAMIDPETGLCAHQARFGEAHVVEQVAALGGGRLDVSAIEAFSEGFLASGDAVLLPDRPGRSSPQYSTADHLALEQRVLGDLDSLSDTRVDGIDPTLVDQAIATEEQGLGADQAGAVRVLCGPGPAIRSLIAPAGFGKTTAVHAAGLAAARAGRPVVGLAATNQAANELSQAGVPAMTIARFALDGAALPPGAVVVLDEVSQVATVDAETVLAAVAATPGARLWCLGDPHQAQAVRAGGLAAEIGRLSQAGRVPAGGLTENRRQLDQAEREALAHYRAGRVALSQALRAQHGWEHDCGTPHATREALAEAVAADISRHGPAGVVALAVAHADCEDLADRVRARLRASGHLHGPEMAGPGWATGERRYAAGDRLLVHGTLHTPGRRLHNGSVVTIADVQASGLQAVDQQGRPVFLPRPFVKGRRGDGSPNCSHGWARTVDGIQGGTWPQAHLLGTAALERYTGYTGQSRGRHATHTWNVTRLPDIDHGGVLADQRAPDQEVLAALCRLPDTGFAVHDATPRLSDLLDRQATLRALLRQRPPDAQPALREAHHALLSAQNELHWANHRLDTARSRLEGLRPLSQLRRQGRHNKTSLSDQVSRFTDDVGAAHAKIERCQATLAATKAKAEERSAWDADHDWPDVRLRAVGATLERLSPNAAHRDRLRQGRDLDHDRPSAWLERLAEATAAFPPAADRSHGIDLGP